MEPNLDRKHSVFERNKFYASTTLAGFGYIQRSNSRIEVLFWYIIIISFLYVTGKNVFDLTSQYMSQTTVTRVSVSRLNYSYDMKRFKLRLKLGLPELNPEFHKFDRTLYNGINFWKVPYNVSLADEVDSALAKLDSIRSVFNTSWNYVLLPLLSRYGFYMSACEFFSEFCNHDKYATEFRTIELEREYVVKGQIEKVFAHFRNLSLTDRDVLEELGRQMLRWVRFKRSPDIFNPWRGRSMGALPSSEGPMGGVMVVFELEPSVPVRVGLAHPSGFCMRVQISKFVDLFHDMSILGPDATKKDVHEWYAMYEPSMEIQFGHDNRRQLNSQLGQISYWSIEIASTFHSSSNCLRENNKNERIRNCTASQIERRCGCSPVLMGDGQNLDWCTPQHYSSCLHNVNENLFSNCTNSCPSECDIDFIETQLADAGPLHKSDMEICINIFHKEVPTFREHESHSWQQFMAELGGAIDFWLGASVVSLVHLMVHFGKQIVYAFKPTTKTGTLIRSATHSEKQPNGRRRMSAENRPRVRFSIPEEEGGPRPKRSNRFPNQENFNYNLLLQRNQRIKKELDAEYKQLLEGKKQLESLLEQTREEARLLSPSKRKTFRVFIERRAGIRNGELRELVAHI